MLAGCKLGHNTKRVFSIKQIHNEYISDILRTNDKIDYYYLSRNKYITSDIFLNNINKCFTITNAEIKNSVQNNPECITPV